MSSGNSREKHEEKNHCPYPFRHALCALLFSRGAADGAKRPRGTAYGCGVVSDRRTRSVFDLGLSSHFSQRDHIEGCKRRECFHLDDPGGSALLSRRQTGNWTPMAAIRLCTSQCPIRRHSYSLVADSADNPQISAA